MQNFLNAIEKSLSTENWYAALTSSLILPDICGSLEDPEKRSGERYVAWFRKWVQPIYTKSLRADVGPHIFLSGDDCYALRCALLHQGEADISQQRAQKALESFRFLVPAPNHIVHCNQNGAQLELQVDRFCHDICRGVEGWLAQVETNQEIQKRISQLISIEITPKSGPIVYRV